MKKVLVVIAVLLSISAIGQVGSWTPQTGRNRWVNGIGFGFKDTSLYTNPGDTSLLVAFNGILYYRHLLTDTWERVTTNVNAMALGDTLFNTGFTSRVRDRWGLDSLGGLVLHKADTAAMLSGYPRKTTTLNINGVSQTLAGNREWRTAQASTGALTYTGLTITSATQVSVGSVTGYVIDNETNPNIPVYTAVSYAGATNITVPTIGSGTISYLLVNSAGTLVWQNTYPTSAQRKTMIYLSKVAHPAGTLTVSTNEVDFMTSPVSQLRDWAKALNYINEGIFPYSSAANTTFATTSGTITGNGINFVTSNTTPNTLAYVGTTTTTFSRRTQTGNGASTVTTIDPGNYDVAGTITAVGGGAGSSTIQYIFAVPASGGIGYIVQYGQTVYSTLANAVAAVSSETFTQYPPLTGNAILVGILCVNKSATNLTDPAQAQFFKASKFGEATGSTAGTSTGTLQSVYNNSIAGTKILTDATRDGFSVQRGSLSDGDANYLGLNGAGTTTFVVSGAGNLSVTGTVTAASYSGSGTSLFGVVKYTDTASMLSNRLKISDTATMLAPYARTANVTLYQQFKDSINAFIVPTNGGKPLRMQNYARLDGGIGINTSVIPGTDGIVMAGVNAGSGNYSLRIARTTGTTTGILMLKAPAFQIIGGDTENNPASIGLISTQIGVYGNKEIGAGHIELGGTRSTAAQLYAGTYTAVANGDALGSIFFVGDDGTNTRTATAAMTAYVNTTEQAISTGIIPTELRLRSGFRAPITMWMNSTEYARFNYSSSTGFGFGLNTTAPTHTLTLGSASTGIAALNTADQTNVFERFRGYWSSNTYRLWTDRGTGASLTRPISIGNSQNSITIDTLTTTITNGLSVAGNISAVQSKYYSSTSLTTLRGLVGTPTWDGSYVAIQNGTLAELAANIALAQGPTGATQVNAASGTDLSLRIANADRLVVSGIEVQIPANAFLTQYNTGDKTNVYERMVGGFVSNTYRFWTGRGNGTSITRPSSFGNSQNNVTFDTLLATFIKPIVSVGIANTGTFSNTGNVNITATNNGQNIIGFGRTTVLTGAPGTFPGSSFIVGTSSTASGAPSYLSFYTTESGTVGERVRIDSAGDLYAIKKFFVAGNTTIGGTLGVTGLSTLATLSVTGAATVGGALAVTGNITGTLATAAQPNITSVGALSNLTVSGAATVSNLSVTGTATIGNITITGAAIITSGNINLANNASLAARDFANTGYKQLISRGVTNRVEIDADAYGTTFGGAITATSIIKSGGLSSQYLMADGSTSTGSVATVGTYVPTFSLIGGTFGSITSDSANYTIQGNLVTVDGYVTGSISGALNAVTLTCTLPTARNNTYLGNMTGVITIATGASTAEGGSIYQTGASTNVAYFNFTTNATATRTLTYHFTYRIN